MKVTDYDYYKKIRIFVLSIYISIKCTLETTYRRAVNRIERYYDILFIIVLISKLPSLLIELYVTSFLTLLNDPILSPSVNAIKKSLNNDFETLIDSDATASSTS